MSDIPRQRIAAVVMITDGQVHDVPASDPAAIAQELGTPLHVLLSGRPDEGDRRLVGGRPPPRRPESPEFCPRRKGEPAEVWDRGPAGPARRRPRAASPADL